MNSGASEEPVARGHSPTNIVGPDFLGLQVRDLERAASFYEQELGMERVPSIPPDMVVFRTSTIPFAVRKPLPGTNLDAGRPGLGVSISLRVDDAQVLHDRLRNRGVPILIDPFDTPFGLTFVFQDPDGYAVAIHGAM
jgi:predicted enzyme related to lactoylglutathione lyase